MEPLFSVKDLRHSIRMSDKLGLVEIIKMHRDGTVGPPWGYPGDHLLNNKSESEGGTGLLKSLCAMDVPGLRMNTFLFSLPLSLSLSSRCLAPAPSPSKFV